MKNQLKWRLGKLPSVDELLRLVNDKLITKEEANEMMFSNETEIDIEKYKQEIKFLKEVIEKLGDRSSIIQVVKEYVPHYISQPFYTPYWTYCNTASLTSGATNLTSGSLTNYAGVAGSCSNAVDCSFSSIQS